MLLVAGFVTSPIVCGWALWRGDAVLRIAAVLTLVSTVLGLVFQPPEQILFPIDIALMLTMMTLSLLSRRLWTLPAGALMIDRVAIYAFNDIDVVDTLGYICAFGLLLCLAVGIFEQEARRLHMARPVEANG